MVIQKEKERYAREFWKMVEKVFKENNLESDTIAWWGQQPHDFWQDTVAQFDRVLENGNESAIDRAMKFSESEFKVWGSFRKKAKSWVESEQRMNPENKISLRLLDPNPESEK